MNEKIDFLSQAIEDARSSIRFSEAKAGALIIFESALLAVAVFSLASNPFIRLVKALVENNEEWLAAVLLASFVVVAMALIVHILLTIRVVLPVDKPAEHVNLGDIRPKGLFHLSRLDHSRQIVPSIAEYSEKLAGLSEEELINEYIFVLQTLSFIRRIKSDRLSLSVLFLAGVVAGITFFGFLLTIVGIVF